MKIYKSLLRSYILNFIVFICPTIFILQIVFPPSVQPSILYFRMIIFPILITFLFRGAIDIKSTFCLIIYSILTTATQAHFDYNSAALTIVTIIDSIILFRWGALLASRYKNHSLWKSLINGLLLLNVATIFVYAGLASGYIDVKAALEFLDLQSPGQNYSRFSFGNAIEVPFIITALLCAAIKVSPNDEGFLYSAFINFLAAAISESRLVIVIALVLLVKEFMKTNIRKKIGSLLILIAIFTQINIQDYVRPVYESLVQRYQGNDSGSQVDRIDIAKKIGEKTSLVIFLIGGGIGSSDQLMTTKDGQIRSVESVFFQIFYDLGIFGFLLILLATLIDLEAKPKSFIKPDIITLLILFQLFFFLPIHSRLPLTFFALSVCLYVPTPLAKEQLILRSFSTK